ncbi:hypothetical protein RF11_10286 [Thelohanellus kitauei]|uniref:Uncharacterized protein n=1 Tax=Thelohanellus kitauei TaxID=669202 RepID=A0A0C2IQA0_THEKT|nr:hypothetical protein RF11_10286 [Thelohanellus kitauei]
MIFARPPYLFMKINIIFVDKSNASNLWTESVIYHLLQTESNCSDKLRVSYANNQNVTIYFHVYLSVHMNAPHFTRFHFCLNHNTHYCYICLTDFFYFAILYIESLYRQSEVLPKSIENWSMTDLVLNDNGNESKYIFAVYLKRRLILAYNSSSIWSNLSPMVMINIRVYNRIGEGLDSLIYQMNVSGWRWKPKNRQHPIKLKPCYLFYDNKWKVRF